MRRAAATGSLTKLLDQSSRPIYVVDAERRLTYCNRALAGWMALGAERIVGRVVEYHSEKLARADSERDVDAPLADLCPPPKAFVGEACTGTISCVAPGGRLVHRQADFVPLPIAGTKPAPAGGSLKAVAHAVLVLLAANDQSPLELASDLSGDPSADTLHRTIRQFRRTQAAAYALESILGDSPAMRKVRAQVALAAASGANALVDGPPGSGRGHVGRAIHYHAGGDSAAKLVPLDCRVLNEDLLRRAIDMVRRGNGAEQPRATLLLESLDQLPAPYQLQLLAMIRQNTVPAQIIATICSTSPHTPAELETPVDDWKAASGNVADGTLTRHLGKSAAECPGRGTLDAALLDALSIITIRTPRLVERIEDLPILAQSCLECCNRGNEKQIGSIRPEALDLLALYSWPRELDELREVIRAAHQACGSHAIRAADLPAVIHHAESAASRVPRRLERIVLDDLLATIERRCLLQALEQARGNKTEAAELLGLTRPRLYRRLVQHRLISEPAPDESQAPEFIEQNPTDEAL